MASASMTVRRISRCIRGTSRPRTAVPSPLPASTASAARSTSRSGMAEPSRENRSALPRGGFRNPFFGWDGAGLLRPDGAFSRAARQRRGAHVQGEGEGEGEGKNKGRGKGNNAREVAKEDDNDAHATGPDAEAYRKARLAEIDGLEASGREVFPHKFSTSISVPSYVEKYSALAEGEHLRDVKEMVAGRVMAIRKSGKNLVFIDLHGEGERLQLMCDRKSFEGNQEMLFGDTTFKRGDLVGASGHPGRNQRGELCLIPSDAVLLAPCLNLLPKQHYGVKDPDDRYRKRHLDLVINAGVRSVFVRRSKILRSLRNFFDTKGFIEVETPMLAREACGAAARPFLTHHNEMKMEMFLRIAPELYLKRLIVGGIDRVFEIGKCFRNEGVDSTHNPEFTTVELYQAYADYGDLMEMTEELLQKVCTELHGDASFDSAVATNQVGSPTRISFEGPFKRYDFIKTIEERSGCEMPPADKLETPEAIAQMAAILQGAGIDTSKLQNAPQPALAAHDDLASPDLVAAFDHQSLQLLDKLSSTFIEPLCTQPAFIVDYPLCMSPLAKEHRSIKGLSERFELFVLGRELANAYTELNDPREQRARFEYQCRLRDEGDDEAHQPDYSFCDALEQGMPPTAGWGLGVDRLCMLMLDQPSIREVQLFPTLRPVQGEDIK